MQIEINTLLGGIKSTLSLKLIQYSQIFNIGQNNDFCIININNIQIILNQFNWTLSKLKVH